MRTEFPGAVFHVTSRGNERNIIFRDGQDRLAFLDVLARTVERWGWLIHAYCLMGNHCHLLVETPEANLSRGMRQLNGEYTHAFNRRHRRVGHLFQGRFKAILVEKECHLLELCRYVVLNPVRARGMQVKLPEEWPCSSYRATVGITKTPEWLTTSWILSQFGRRVGAARRNYRHFVTQGIKEKKRIDVRGGLYIGSDSFGERLRHLVGNKKEVREHTRMQRNAVVRRSIEAYFPAEPFQSRADRDEAVYRAYREGRYTQREIGEHLGVHYVTISKIVR